MTTRWIENNPVQAFITLLATAIVMLALVAATIHREWVPKAEQACIEMKGERLYGPYGGYKGCVVKP